jgi:uroporphyrin-3 C-methyltransferase
MPPASGAAASSASADAAPHAAPPAAAAPHAAPPAASPMPPSAASSASSSAVPGAGAPAPITPRIPPDRSATGPLAGLLVCGVLALAALALAWQSGQRVQALEQELVRRQQDSGSQAAEARLLAKQAQEWSQDAVAKVRVLEQRVAEATLQRSQLDELVDSLTRSREENVVADIEAGLRVALQQSAITGSAEPLVAALKGADERLARANQPRLDAVRRAVERDLERVKAQGVADLASLATKLDDAVRLADEAPLRVIDAARGAAPPQAPASAAPPTTASAAIARLPESAGAWWRGVWGEARTLLRVSRVDRPESMLLAPEQGFFLRENLKLRLLNARLSLLSRQFDVAQGDLRAALAAIERYLDPDARKSRQLVELLGSVSIQLRQHGVPRPDDTLGALAAAAAAR